MLVAALSLPPTGMAAEVPCGLPGFRDEPGMPGVPFEDLERQALEARTSGRPLEALRYYRAGVDLNPLWAEGWWRAGVVYSEGGCWAEAKVAAQRTVQLEPDAGRGFWLLGLAEHRLADHDRALVHLARGLPAGVSKTELGRQAILAYVHLLVRAGDFASTSRPLAALVRLDPKALDTTIACGLMALRMPRLPGEIPAADEDLVRSAGRATCAAFGASPDDARRQFEDLLSRYPRSRGVHFAYGLILSADGGGDALPQFRREVELFPDHAEAQIELAFALLAGEAPQEALAPARAAVRLAPNSVWGRVALGRALLAAGATGEAIGELEEAVRLSPDAREAYVPLAQAYAREGRKTDVERARAMLQRLDAARAAAP